MGYGGSGTDRIAFFSCIVGTVVDSAAAHVSGSQDVPLATASDFPKRPGRQASALAAGPWPFRKPRRECGSPAAYTNIYFIVIYLQATPNFVEWHSAGGFFAGQSMTAKAFRSTQSAADHCAAKVLPRTVE
jgi:hypothetical protein